MRKTLLTATLAAFIAGGCPIERMPEAAAADNPPGATGAGATEDAREAQVDDGEMPAENANEDPVLNALIERREELMAAIRERHPLTDEEENAYREMIAEYDIRWSPPRNREIVRHMRDSFPDTLPILNDMINHSGGDPEAFRRASAMLPTSGYWGGRSPEQACLDELKALILIPRTFDGDREVRANALQASYFMLISSPLVQCDCLEPSLRLELYAHARRVIYELPDEWGEGLDEIAEGFRDGLRKAVEEYADRLGVDLPQSDDRMP